MVQCKVQRKARREPHQNTSCPNRREGGQPHFKKLKQNNFLREGVTEHIVKNRNTLFCMICSLIKISLSKIGWEGGGSASIWIMCLNILFVFLKVPLIRDRSCSYLICHLVPTILPAYLQYILCQCFPM